MLATSSARHRLAPVRACLGLLTLAMLITGCGSGSGPATRFPAATPTPSSSAPASARSTPNPTASAIPPAAADGRAPPVAACRSQRCRPTATERLPDGSGLRLWSVPGGAAHPVLQLLRGEQSIAWMMLLRGLASGSTLTCESTGLIANCVIVSPLGVHSGIGQMVLVSDGRLIDTGAFVVGTTPGVVAADLNGDDHLDVAARDSDYRPNFAQGHLFDHTYRYDPERRVFVSTGCTPLLTDPMNTPPPDTLQYRRCPVG